MSTNANQAASSTAHVRKYRERRYRGLDQRIVHGLEARIINGFLDRVCREGDSVLDMPIGYGRFVDDLRQRGCSVVGGDRKQAMLDLCTETWGEEQPLVRLNGDALPFADNGFDGVTCIRLFQHLHDPALRQGVMNEIGRVTRRWAIVTTYLSSPVHSALHRGRGLKRLTRHDPAGLQWMLGRAGLRLVAGQRSMPGLHAQYIMLLEPVDQLP